MSLVSSCSCLCPIHWNQVLSRKWRRSWSSVDRRFSSYIWVINNFITYLGATYIRSFTWMIDRMLALGGRNLFIPWLSRPCTARLRCWIGYSFSLYVSFVPITSPSISIILTKCHLQILILAYFFIKSHGCIMDLLWWVMIHCIM